MDTATHRAAREHSSSPRRPVGIAAFGFLRYGLRMDRVEGFLGDRLRGRRVPADLRRLVELQLDGELASAALPFAEVRVLGPGERHALEEPAEPLASDPYPDETRANGRAIDGVLAQVGVVASGFNGDLWGYWLHPDEPQGVGPLIVKLDTEGQFSIVSGSSLVEAMIFDWAGEDDVSEVAEYCEQHGIPLVARSSDELVHVQAAVDPAVLHEKLFKREHPNHRRPDWADDAEAVPAAAPLGARSSDLRVAHVLALHGLPEDPMPLIRAADAGEGEVVLRSPSCSAELEFHRESETAWFLHQMRFSRASDQRPGCADLPFGLDQNETREQCWSRLGEPPRKTPIGGDRWRFGRVHVLVQYGRDDGKLRSVRCLPALGND